MHLDRSELGRSCKKVCIKGGLGLWEISRLEMGGVVYFGSMLGGLVMWGIA